MFLPCIDPLSTFHQGRPTAHKRLQTPVSTDTLWYDRPIFFSVYLIYLICEMFTDAEKQIQSVLYAVPNICSPLVLLGLKKRKKKKKIPFIKWASRSVFDALTIEFAQQVDTGACEGHRCLPRSFADSVLFQALVCLSGSHFAVRISVSFCFWMTITLLLFECLLLT